MERKELSNFPPGNINSLITYFVSATSASHRNVTLVLSILLIHTVVQQVAEIYGAIMNHRNTFTLLGLSSLTAEALVS